MNARPTIHDVAAAAGVSLATVSKAVNGRYGVSPETTAKVMAVVDALGYESSLVASSMRARRTGVIGVLVADFEPFSSEVLKGVGTAVRQLGAEYDLLAYSGAHQGGADGWERRSLSRLSGTLIDGAILVTPSVLTTTTSVPVVAVDPHKGRADLPSVEADSRGGAGQAVEHLVSLGHRRIGFLAGRPDLRSASLREAGYADALRSAGIVRDPALTRDGDFEMGAARRAARELLDVRPADRPTAVFAANDLSAIAVLRTAHELGLRVPDDLSLVGFDDIPEASREQPALTTVRQPMHRLGTVATTMLFTLLEGGVIDRPEVQLPTKLVVRGTTGPVPAPAPAPSRG
ncbi:LacI family transcriptional regulator [Frigoribacterium sp. ACAM 257]|uniref:LacI family DNA-binding transcriptional regulator n=1 Tax=Frigoribacterium sp. ACAM 257 TaxID=2508998 RepID=UPI0011B99030|nr:LacI family DNA-binding transcriptional regulator [Frigoribacterium sp. ACAM 257]TWX36209.1 LacI family transcriptional regulator [Frigoribacterium sp. ACAM 257]